MYIPSYKENEMCLISPSKIQYHRNKNEFLRNYIKLIGLELRNNNYKFPTDVHAITGKVKK